MDLAGTKRTDFRKRLLKRWYALWPVTAILILYPINNLLLRIAILAALAALWTGLIYFYWNNRIARFGAFVCAGMVAVFLLLPGKHPNIPELRQSYLDALNKYEGTRYIWGGENRLGVDCSGLVRSGLIVANYQQGLTKLNPALVQEGFSLWWHDCSARALGEQYRLKTRLLFPAESINKIENSMLMPGDFAVTSDGVHVMAYLGGQTWIEADPDVKKVVRVKVPSDNPWFSEPVNVMRWTQFVQNTNQ